MVHLLQFLANKGQDVELKHSQILNGDIQLNILNFPLFCYKMHTEAILVILHNQILLWLYIPRQDVKDQLLQISCVTLTISPQTQTWLAENKHLYMGLNPSELSIRNCQIFNAVSVGSTLCPPRQKMIEYEIFFGKLTIGQ